MKSAKQKLLRGVLLLTAVLSVVLTPGCSWEIEGPAIAPEVAVAVQVAGEIL